LEFELFKRSPEVRLRLRTGLPLVGVGWQTLLDQAWVSAKSTRGPGDRRPAGPSTHPEDSQLSTD